MAKAWTVTELVKALIEYDERFEFKVRRGKGSERMIYHPDIDGQARSYPIKYHGKKTEVRAGTFSAIMRRFGLPADKFK